jgi:hypothetical protein
VLMKPVIFSEGSQLVMPGLVQPCAGHDEMLDRREILRLNTNVSRQPHMQSK